MITLENEELLVEISPHGAELQKIYSKKDEIDYLWSGDETYWGRHAPILFPIIGRLNEDKFKKGDEIYELSQHGFARDKTFEVEGTSDETAIFTLQQDDDTLDHYPYEFKLTVTYTLIGKLLSVDFKVENQSEERMPFSIGGHPAFNVPLNGEGNYEDYTISISPKHEAQYFESDPVPFRSGSKRILEAMKDGILPLNHETFRNGLIIIDEPKVDMVTLAGPENKHGVTLNVGEFPYLCLWTKEQGDAPFICIEPFFGLPDIAGEIGQLEDKGGIILLEEGEERQLGFTMEMF